MSTNTVNLPINLTVELCAADRARLDNILGVMIALYKTQNDTQPAPVAEVKHEAPKAPEVPEDPMEPAPSPVVPKPAVSLFDIQSLAQTMLAPGSTKRAQVRQIITSYAPKLSDIPVEKYTEVMEKLTALKGA